MTDNKNILREDAIIFALTVSEMCDCIKGCSVYTSQLVRSSSSIGANIHEAKYAQSRADFIHKLEIALKECSESEYWLELLFRKQKLEEDQYKSLKNSCGSLRRRLISSITTARIFTPLAPCWPICVSCMQIPLRRSIRKICSAWARRWSVKGN